MVGSQVGVEGQITVGGQVGQVGGEGVGGQVTVGGQVGQVGGEGVGGQEIVGGQVGQVTAVKMNYGNVILYLYMDTY